MGPIIAVAGLLAGFIFLRSRPELIGKIAFVVFSIALPYVVVIEVSSMKLNEWWFFVYGSGFVLLLYGLGIVMRKNADQSALLATAEGGTMGFVLYNLIDTESLSRFFLIDMLGNGGALFSFIYWRVGREFKLKSFLKNPLMVAMAAGVVANIAGLHLLRYQLLSTAEPIVTTLTTLMICMVVGAGIKIQVSREIFYSRNFATFWAVRAAGAVIIHLAHAPLALTILFILPPSFLLPVIYGKGDDQKREYASSFIAACLPITLALSVILCTAIKFG